MRLFSTANSVIAEAEKQKPLLFLLDIMVPGGDGFDLCRQIRSKQAIAMTPVIFLTAKTGEPDRVLGFELGADDYISKPFSPREVVARVKAVLRRFSGRWRRKWWSLKTCVIDCGAMTLTVRGALVATTATNSGSWITWRRHPGRVFSRDQLLDAVWRETAFVTPRSVDVYVRRLREKIEKDPEQPQYLRTVRGAGYRFGATK